jgi:uncharacterized protein YjeT (DUF2065 family)
MRAILAVLVLMIAFDAVFLTSFPDAVKRLVAALSPGELRAVGIVEALIAAVVIYYLVAGIP